LDFGKIGFIDRSGTLVVKPAFYGAGDFAANGLAPVRLDRPTKESLGGSEYISTGKWEYINSRGEVIIPGPFKGVSDFGEKGLAVVQRDDDTLDFIDAHGSFKTSQHFKDWDALGLTPGVHGAWSPPELPPLPAQVGLNEKRADVNQMISGGANGLRSYSQESLGSRLWGYVYAANAGNEIAIRPQFQFAGEFAKNGLARVMDDNKKSGYINDKGIFVIPPEFDCAWDFAPDGLARAMRDGKWGFIDSSGKFIIQSQYPPVTDFSRAGYAQVSDKERSPEYGQCWDG
jgi:hypothetical protein